MNFLYILTLVIFAALYVAVICLMKFMRNTALTNAILMAAVLIPYVALSVTIYRDVGFYDWNFQNTLPVANASPFMFTCVPLALILPKRIREHFLLLISLLSVGMLLSGTFGCIYNAVRNYKFHIHFTYDYMAHFALSLFGVYLVKSKQVTPSVKNALISSSVIVGAAAIMMILNVIFDTAFFGLSLNGKHNIYNVVLTDSSYLSALLYFFGLAVILTLGYLYCGLFNRNSAKKASAFRAPDRHAPCAHT